MNVAKSISLFALVCVSVLAARPAGAQLAPVGAHYAGRPSDTGHAGQVNASGGYQTSVPLDLPPARGGLPVPLHITYGGRAMGAAGLGWDIPLSYIWRDTTLARRRPLGTPGVAPQPREQLVLVLDGQRMDLVKKGAVWVARRDAVEYEVRAIRDGGMVMYDGEGRTYTFSAQGGSGGAPLANGNLLLLRQIRGVDGNTVLLTHQILPVTLPDGGSGTSINLARVYYNVSPAAGQCAKTEIVLEYDAPAAAPLSLWLLGGQVFARMNTLQVVDVRSHASCAESSIRLRHYQLTYQPDTDTQQPRLAKVEMTGRWDSSERYTTVPVASYSYGSIATTAGPGTKARLRYALTQTQALPPALTPRNALSRTLYPGNPLNPDGFGPGTVARENSALTFEHLLDMTGDGRPDFVVFEADPNDAQRSFLALKRGLPGSAVSVDPIGQPLGQPILDEQDLDQARHDYTDINTQVSYYQTIDVNGDGRIDLIDAATSPDSWMVYLNTPDPADPGHIVWQTRAIDTRGIRAALADAGYISQGSRTRIPLMAKTTGKNADRWGCFAWDGSVWQEFPDGFHDGTCPLLGAADKPEELTDKIEQTFTSWALQDINGDGYVDFVFNSSPIVHVVDHRVNDPTPPQPGDPFSKRSRITLRLRPAQGASNQVMAMFNIAGVHLDTQATSAFSAPVVIRPASACGFGLWTQALVGSNAQLQTCTLMDINGDAIADFVDGGKVYLGTGVLSDTGFFTPGVMFKLPFAAAGYSNTHDAVCVNSATEMYATHMIPGLRDINGDGIPDYVTSQSEDSVVMFGTATGYSAPVPTNFGFNFQLSVEQEDCGGVVSRTISGLYDMDGDGKPEMVTVQGGNFSIYQLTGGSRPGIPEAGMLVGIENGYGASTRIQYRSAKEDALTTHQVPFPEIVVSSVETVRAQGPMLAPTSYAYGDASLIFDPARDEYTFAGYGRSVELRLTRGTEGVAVISDRYPLAAFDPAMSAADRYGRYLRVGRPRDSTTLTGSLGSDAWALLATDVTTDVRRTAGVHHDWGIRVFSESPDAEACVDMVSSYDFAASRAASAGMPDVCAAHGFAFEASTDSWHGSAAPPAANNVRTHVDITSVDSFARPLTITQQNDVARSDDDVCVTIEYAAPTGANERVLSAIASRTTRSCGSPAITLAKDRWEYDNLPPGFASSGFATSHSVERRDSAGALLGTVREYDTVFDGNGNPTKIATKREDGASRTITVTYEPFGLAAMSVTTAGTGVATTVMSATRDPLTLNTLTITDPNGTQRGTRYDGFDRPVMSTVTPPGGTAGAVSVTSYLGFNLGDSGERRIVEKVFTDPVDPAATSSTAGRTSTVVLDELGRELRTELALGASYQNQLLTVHARTYDLLGRVVFEADPFPSTQTFAGAYGTTRFFAADGTPRCFVRGYGQLPALVTVTDEAHETFPTCFARTYDNHTSLVSVQDAASLLPGSPQAGVVATSYLTAAGALITRATTQGTSRLEYATFTHDALGHLTSMTRYQDPAVPGKPVTSTWQYDSLGQVVELDEPDSAPQRTTYSSWGEATEILRARDADTTTRIVMQYDALGRLVHRAQEDNGAVVPDTVNDYFYDTPVDIAPQVHPTNVLGRLTAASAPTGSVSFSYDGLGQINARVFTDNLGGTYVETHTTHADGTPAALDLFLPDTGFADEHVAYDYDSAGRGTSVTYAAGGTTQVLFTASTIDPFGRVRDAQYGQTRYTASYAEVGRRLQRQVSVASPFGSRSIRHADLTAYDPLGRERSRSEDRQDVLGLVATSSYAYTYDALGRLAASGSNTPALNQQFTYDALGNVLQLRKAPDTPGEIATTLSYQETDRDRICRISFGRDSGDVCNVAYDAAGNITVQPTLSGERRYSYLADGHVRTISDDRGNVAHFRYDPFGAVQELDISSERESRHDRHYGDLLTWRDEGTGSATTPVLTRKIPGPQGFVATRHGAGTACATLIASGPTSSSCWSFEFGETRGTRFVTDERGAFVQDVSYSSFGEETSTGAGPGTSLYSNAQWNGGDALVAFGISQLGARLYDPAIGRFLSRDPLLIPRTATTTHPYAFANNDPINNADPSGLCIDKECHPDPPLISLPSWDDIKDGANAVWDFFTGGGGGAPASRPPPSFSHNPATSPPDTGFFGRMANRVRAAGGWVADFGRSAASSVVDAVAGTVNMFVHPVDTAMAIGRMAHDWRGTVRLLATSAYDTAAGCFGGNPALCGKIAAAVGTVFSGAAVAEIAELAQIAEIAGVVGEAAGTASEVAGAAAEAAEAAEAVEQVAQGVGFGSFRAFKSAVGPAGEGMQWHHIVEQTAGNVTRFGEAAIHNTGNLIRLETGLHRRISGFYSSIQPFSEGGTVRQWLSSQTLGAQQEFGRQVMIQLGVTF